MALSRSRVYHIKFSYYPKKNLRELLGLFTGRDSDLFGFSIVAASTSDGLFFREHIPYCKFYLHQMSEYDEIRVNDLPLYFYMPFKSKLFEELIKGDLILPRDNLIYNKITF